MLCFDGSQVRQDGGVCGGGSQQRAETRVCFRTRRRLWKGEGMTGIQGKSHRWLEQRRAGREAGWGGGAQLKQSSWFGPVQFLRHT